MFRFQLVLSCLLFAEAAMAQPATHCRADETVFFSCPLAPSHKLVSLCGQKSDDDRVLWLQYRFGKPGQPEFVFPSRREGSVQAFSRFQQTVRSAKLDIREIWFRSGSFTYLIEAASGGEQEPDAQPDDVLVVFRDGVQVVATHSCIPPSENRLFELDDQMPDDPAGRPG